MFASQIGHSVKNKESVANEKLMRQTANDVALKGNEIQQHSTREQMKSASDSNQKKITTQSSIQSQRRRETVAKELGTSSTAFIGPTSRPVARCAAQPKPNIEESLNDFYKELEQCEQANSSIDTTDKNIPVQTYSGLVPPVPNGRSHNLEGKGPGPNHPHRPHWYQNEPYHVRMHGPTQNPAYYHPQRTWHHPPPCQTQPYPQFHRLPHSNPPSPGPFGDPDREPQMNRSWGYPEPANQYQQQCSQFPPLQRAPPAPGKSSYSQVYNGAPSQHLDRDQGHRGYGGPTYEAVGYSDPYEDQDSDWRILSYTSQQQENQHLPLNTTHNSSPPLVLILMRGAPGSGKSTLAKELLSTSPSGLVLSTDDYFSEEQDYIYDPSLLGKAHVWNQNRAKEAMQKGSSPVVIDNTNLQAWEMKPYVKLAVEKGYSVLFHEPATSWKCDPVELERRNKHGVSREKIAQMLDRFEFPISVEIVMHSCDPPHQRMRQLAPNHQEWRTYN